MSSAGSTPRGGPAFRRTLWSTSARTGGGVTASAHNRTGYTVSTKLGHAVVRNRVRRRLREIFRLNQSGLAQGYDMILVARTRAVGAEYRELERAFLSVCGKLGLREKKP